MPKRGLSQTVSTLMIILLILIAIAGIWAVLSQTVFSQTSRINLGSITTEVKITKIDINGTDNEVKVKVQREGGGEEIDSIKIIIKDDENSDVYDKKVVDFLELSERSFTLNLSERGVIDINKIREISVAPVFILEGEEEPQIGRETDSFKVSNAILAQINIETGGNSGSGGSSGGGQGSACDIKSDCGEDYWIEDTQICSEDSNSVMQYKKVYSCSLGFCTEENQLATKQNCFESESCFNAQCILDPIPCTNETIHIDCGYSDYVGEPSCSQDQTQVIQSYQNYTCLDGFCAETIAPSVLEQCNETEICFDAECFVPLECSANSDCDLGEICEEGSCVEEELLLNGTVKSIWPFDKGEYFDSEEFPSDEETEYSNDYIIFPNSSENRCLNIREFKKPSNLEEGTPYVRLSKSDTNITINDYFEIWETNYACTLV